MTRPLYVVGTFIAAAAATALTALIAAFTGFHRDVMLLVAACSGCAAALPAVFLVYRQVVVRQAAQSALRDAQARVGGIVDSAMDAIISVDESQRVVQFNAAAERVFRWPRGAVIGQRLDMLIPERFRAAHAGHIGRFARTATTSRGMGAQTVLYGLRADATEFPIEASISQIGEEGHRLFTVILRDVSERVRADEALRESRDEMRALSLAAQNLGEQEKSRVARELHDELGQALTALKIDVGWIKGQGGARDPAVQAKLSSMQLLLDGTVAATRRISADLRPLVLDDLGLAAAADWLAHNFTNRTGIPCELAVGKGFEDMPEPHATTLFRALQESLTNVAKHAQARQVEVDLAGHGDQVSLTVRDDGLGFSTSDPRKPASFGLMGIRERAALLGGDVSIDSAPGRGTIIRMRLPKPASGEPA